MNTNNAPGMTKAALLVCMTVAEAIRDLGSVPSGHLYAAVMSKMDIHSYENVIQILVNSNLVRRDAWHMLTWIGPTLTGKVETNA